MSTAWNIIWYLLALLFFFSFSGYVLTLIAILSRIASQLSAIADWYNFPNDVEAMRQMEQKEGEG